MTPCNPALILPLSNDHRVFLIRSWECCSPELTSFVAIDPLNGDVSTVLFLLPILISILESNYESIASRLSIARCCA